MNQNKTKKCKVCNTIFEKIRPMQTACSPRCALKLVEAKKRKEFIKETRTLKKKLKTRKDYLKEAQFIFNKYIRLRDKDDPCISCGRYHKGQYQAGHYKSVGAYPELRFEELNCHKQCSACNDGNKLSGNIHEYRKGLIVKIGISKVEWLEGPHEQKKLSINDILEIKKTYQTKIKEILKNEC